MTPLNNPYWARHLKRNNRSELTRIQQLFPLESVVTIDVSKVIDNATYEQIIETPKGQIEEIQETAIELENLSRKDKVTVRFVNIKKKMQIRDFRATKDEGKLRSIACLVKRVSIVQPKIIEAVFRCPVGHFSKVKSKYDRIVPPKSCHTDGCNFRDLEYVGEQDKKINRQFIQVQEILENLTGGQQPSSLRCEVFEDLCNVVTTGERVVLNGMYRSLPKFKDGVLQAGKDFYFEVNSIEREDCGYDEVKWNDEDEKKIRAYAADPDIFSKLTSSIAPSVVGMRLWKQAIVLMLFGGVTRRMPDGTIRRGWINVLCVTDPGMAKTVVLKFVARVSPRGVYASAATASKVGLVAPIVTDELTGQLTIEPGPYMLANKGIFCLDECNMIAKDDSKYIGECMENGECHITKAVNALVKTEAPLLGACNPDNGSFDPNESYAKQIKKIDESILSRYDIKILLLDLQDEEKDKRMAAFISGSYLPQEDKEQNTGIIEPEDIRKYIAIARECDPISTKEAGDLIDAYWVKVRKECGNDEKTKITHRQHATIHHLAEGHARTRLSKTVDIIDAQAAIDHFDMGFRNVNTDSQGRLNLGMTEHQGKEGLPNAIIRTIKDLGGETKKASEMSVINALKKSGHDEQKIENTIRLLLREGKLSQPLNGLLRIE
jgi:replicative DNA helicase Mcm